MLIHFIRFLCETLHGVPFSLSHGANSVLELVAMRWIAVNQTSYDMILY